MPALTVTAIDINHAVRRVEELAGAIKRFHAGKRLTAPECKLILACAPNPRGRPEVESYQSIGEAASKMAIPMGHLKALKRMGCPAFRGSRVYPADLRDWLDANPVDELKLLSPMDMEKLRGMKAVRSKHELANDIRRGEYFRKDTVCSRLAMHVATARSVMTGKGSGLAMILASVTGADPIMIEDKIRERDDEVIAAMHVDPWATRSVKCECGKEIEL